MISEYYNNEEKTINSTKCRGIFKLDAEKKTENEQAIRITLSLASNGIKWGFEALFNNVHQIWLFR